MNSKKTNTLRTEIINKYKVRFYDSIETIPATKYKEFNRFVVLDAGIGSDIDSIVKKNNVIISYIQAGKGDLAAQLLSNQNQAYRFILGNQNLEFQSFQQLIHSIDGKEPTPELIEKLNPPMGLVKKIVEQFKKKAKTKLRYSLRPSKAQMN